MWFSLLVKGINWSIKLREMTTVGESIYISNRVPECSHDAVT